MSIVFHYLPQTRRSLVHIVQGLCFHCHVCSVPLAAIYKAVLFIHISVMLFYCHVGSVPLAVIDKAVLGTPISGSSSSVLPCL